MHTQEHWYRLQLQEKLSQDSLFSHITNDFTLQIEVFQNKAKANRKHILLEMKALY